MDPSALESVSRSLESSVDWWGVFILVSTLIVAAGLVVEYWEPVHEFIEECRRPAAALPWKKFWGLTGGILVTVGVFGEFWGAYRASRVETKLRDNNHKIEESLNVSAKSAADAADRAKASGDEAKQKADAVSRQADDLKDRLSAASQKLGELEHNLFIQSPRGSLLLKAAPEMVKQLSPFAGQKVEMFICGSRASTQPETTSTWARLANILYRDGAKWKPGHGGLTYWNRCDFNIVKGIAVRVNKRAQKDTLDAANALSKALSKVLPPPPSDAPEIVDPELELPFIAKGLEDENSPTAWAAKNPDLVVVVISVHPEFEVVKKSQAASKAH
jgi:hypothetical protein